MYDFTSENLQLKLCPFCGSSAELREVNQFNKRGVCVKCVDCATMSRCIVETRYLQYKGKRMVDVTFEQAIKDVMEAWNKRKKCFWRKGVKP